MATLEFNKENKRIAMADKSSATYLPTEDTENERISITSSTVIPIVFETTGDGYYTIKDRTIEEEYIDPSSINLSVDEDGYALIPE